MTNKEKYIQFCIKEENLPIFSHHWWLDAVYGNDNWDVILIEKGGQIVSSMPYSLSKKHIFSTIMMPELTQVLGPYIKYPTNQKYYKKLSFEKEVMTNIIEKLPKFDYFSQNFNNNLTNWLPFYWNDFNQTTRYTYVIENISLDDFEKKCENDIRRRIKKANSLGVEVYESGDIEKFYELNKLTFLRQGITIPYTFELIKNLYQNSKINNSVKMFFAKYEDDIIAANFIVFDKNTVYYLIGGINPDKKDLGGMDLVLHESIKFAIKSNRKFDFEGSMIESIEKYFRSFGAIQVPYFNIKKVNSKILNFREPILNIFKRK